MKDHIYSFERLVVWQRAKDFVKIVYSISKKFPKEELYGLTNQIRRASVSICSNIAEGSSRTSSKEQAHYTQLSYSSLMEVLNHFYIAYDLTYCKQDDIIIVKKHVFELSNLLNSLRKTQLKRHTSVISKRLNN